MTDAPERLQLLWGITVFSGALAQLTSLLTGLPSVVLLLASGLLIGRSGLGLVDPLALGSGLETIVGLLVSLVLFDGGLKLSLRGSTARIAVLRIVIVRMLLALPAGLLAAHWLAGLSWPLAAVYSAIVLGTGPTVVTPLLQQMRLAPPGRCAGRGRTGAGADRGRTGPAAAGTGDQRSLRLAGSRP